MKPLPSLPNELLMHILHFIPTNDLTVFLFVCRYTHHIVSGKVYKKVNFPDTLVSLNTIINFCQKHGSSLNTIKLPLDKRYSDTFFMLLFQLCPRLEFLQSSITPKQLKRLLPRRQYPFTCFKITHLPSTTTNTNTMVPTSTSTSTSTITSFYNDPWYDDLMETIQDHYNITSFTCCSSLLLFPHHPIPDSTLTHITHYYHHVGALQNAILPTFGPDLLSLTLNIYDVLTPAVAQLIAKKCPRLRYLHAPLIKAEGLWMLLHKCNTLVTIVVGGGGLTQNDQRQQQQQQHYPNEIEGVEREEEEEVDNRDENNWLAPQQQQQQQLENDEEEEDPSTIQWMNERNEKAIATVTSHKRVWGIHQQPSFHPRLAWHLNILPKL
ncbi:hypothetical protein BJ944DRAFT_265579 [Cunninghamella echinulata]|nr:hypothetical protein BJ944DRAFT_265579 [Cunninghamella echinulata]